MHCLLFVQGVLLFSFCFVVAVGLYVFFFISLVRCVLLCCFLGCLLLCSAVVVCDLFPLLFLFFSCVLLLLLLVCCVPRLCCFSDVCGALLVVPCLFSVFDCC